MRVREREAWGCEDERKPPPLPPPTSPPLPRSFLLRSYLRVGRRQRRPPRGAVVKGAGMVFGQAVGGAEGEAAPAGEGGGQADLLAALGAPARGLRAGRGGGGALLARAARGGGSSGGAGDSLLLLLRGSSHRLRRGHRDRRGGRNCLLLHHVHAGRGRGGHSGGGGRCRRFHRLRRRDSRHGGGGRARRRGRGRLLVGDVGLVAGGAQGGGGFGAW